MELKEVLPEEYAGWADAIGCAITVCNTEGKILYMNDRSCATFAKNGSLIGANLMPCHSERSKGMIRHMLATGDTNVYTIRKNGQKKIIYQSPWRREGKIAGMVEISIPLPDEMPHYER